MSDAFTKEIFAWLNQVAGDAEIPATASKLAIVLTRYLNRQTGEAWPAISTLAADIAGSDNTVRAALRAMQVNGHIEVQAGGGRKTTNRYRMTLKDKSGANKPCKILKGNDKKPSEELKGIENKPCEILEGLESQTLQNRDENPSTFEHKPFRKLKGNHYKNHLKEPSEGKTLSPPDENSSDDGFEEFFAAYPKQVKINRARQAFRTARKAGASLSDLIDGAHCLKARRDAEEPDSNKRFRFTPDPHNWLANEGWRDPTPPASPSIAGNVVTLPTRRASAPDPMEMYRRAGLNPETLDMGGAS